jgi:hypothetical protein
MTKLTTCWTTNCGTKTWRIWRRKRKKRKRKRREGSRISERENCRTKTLWTRTLKWLKGTMTKRMKSQESRRKIRRLKMRNSRWRRKISRMVLRRDKKMTPKISD